MLEPALDALVILADPSRLVMLVTGVACGIVLGMLPGLGGVAAVSILLPFIYTLDSYAGLAMLLGALGVIYTADTITSVLVGTPGSPASAPTAIEGHAMARQGQAGRALGAAFVASMLGGLIGALVLTLAIPVAGPLVLLLRSPELLMLAILGLYYACSLVGKSPAKGLLSGLFGLLLGCIGAAPAAIEYRYTFGQAYLLDGLSLVIIALGFFGVAEVMSMLGRGGAISHERIKLSGWMDGARDVTGNFWLAIKGAVIGVIGGLIPAVGANASTWVSYGHAVASSKDRSRFGKGEPRGIVASEGANNATVTADLVPTMLFGVPGGPAAAIFMGALFIYGYWPGPRFVQSNQELMFVIVWSAALAAVMGAALCFLISPWIARLTRISFAIIASPLILVMILGAYQSSEHFGDLWVLALFGLIGWAMKQADWPRAPLLIGFVLSDPIERNFWLTYQIHGWGWIGRPAVLVIASLILVPLAIKLVKRVIASRRAPRAEPRDTVAASAAIGRLTRRAGQALSGAGQGLGMALRDGPSLSLLLSFGALAVFAYAFWLALGFRPDSRLVPLLAIVPALMLAPLAVLQDLRELAPAPPRARPEPVSDGAVGGPPSEAAGPPRPQLLQLGIFGLFLVGIWATGFHAAAAAYVLLLLIWRANMSLLFAVPYAALVVFLADRLGALMRLAFPGGALVGY